MTTLDSAGMTHAEAVDGFSNSRSLRAAGVCLLIYAGGICAFYPAIFAAFLAQYFETIVFYLPALLGPICAIGVLARMGETSVSDSLRHLMGRLPSLAAATVGLLLVFAAYTTVKFKIPDLVPFHADSWAASLDALLHGGDPWRWAHAVWPDAWSGFLVSVYSKLWFAYWFATPLIAVLWLKPERATQYLWAFLLTLVVCGNIMAVALSSVGPIFWHDLLGDGRFDALRASLVSLDGNGSILMYADYLLESHASKEAVFGTGISALPSMHVAVVVLNAWFFSQMNRWAGVAAWSFAALIQFGSVYTGWHYAIDGYLSAIAVTLIWVLVKRAHGGRMAWRQAGQSIPAA